tara:strand:- start:464 stop:1264 length:801 start_codon:yes stop_codon:yes gene_type:complete
MQDELLIPYAWENAQPVSPLEAKRERNYSCPICNGDVFLRSGKIKRRHFAHRKGKDSCSATAETVEHLNAKALLFKSLKGYCRSIYLDLQRPCDQCGDSHYTLVPLDENLGTPVMEYSFETSSGKRLRSDLAVLNADESIRLLIEVRATSAVDGEKVSVLREDKIPWFEVEAEDILQLNPIDMDNPLVEFLPVKAIDSDNFIPQKKCTPIPDMIQKLMAPSYKPRKEPPPLPHKHRWTEWNRYDRRMCWTCKEWEGPETLTKIEDQ